jgi:hypothetical protein
MGKKLLTRSGAVALLTGMEAALKNKSTQELSNEVQINAMKAELGKTLGMDAESISFDIGTVKDLNSKLPTDAKVIGNMDKNVEFKANGADVESFDAINTTNFDEIRLAAINVVAANYTTEQDGIISLFSTESIDGKSVGKEIKAIAPNITINSENINGHSVGGDKVSLISNLDNTEIFGASKIKYIPILRSTGDYKTSDYLDADLADTITYNGEEVETAPILVGKEVSLRRLCSTTTYLTTYKDQINPSITLAPDGGLKAVILKLNGDAGLVNKITLPVVGDKSARYSPITNAKEKDINLTFSTVQRLNVGTLVSSGRLSYTSTDGSYVLANGNGELLEIDVKFTVTAKANTDKMSFVSTGTALELVAVYNNGVAMLPAEARYIAIKAIIDGGSVVSIDMNHFLSNSNNLENGMIIDVDAEKYIIPAIYRQPVTIRKSILGDVPAEDIPGYISAGKIALNSTKAVEALALIDDFIDSTEGKRDPNTGVLINYESTGIGSNFIKSLVLKFPVDATAVTNEKSTEKKGDIARHIYDCIVNRAIKAFADSNLDKATAAILPGEKIVLALSTNSVVASYLKTAIAMDDGKDDYPFSVEVYTSMKLGNRVLGTFKIGTGVNELSPLILIEANDHVYKGVQTTANGTEDVTKIIPRRGMDINTPIIFDATVSGIVAAFDN